MKLPLIVVALIIAPVTATHAAQINCWIEGRTIVYSDQPPPEGAVLAAMPGPEPPPVVRAPDVPVADTAPPSLQSATVSATPATVDEILTLSGFRAQLPAIGRSLRAEFVARLGALADDRDGARVARMIARQFTPEPMYAAVRDELRRRLDATQLGSMAVWFRSPLALKITALEIAASESEAAPRIASFVAQLKTSPPTASRTELAQRLDWVMGMSEDTADLSVVIAASLERAAAASAPAERRLRVGVVDRGIDEMRGRIAPVVRENVFGQMLYMYAPLTDAELKAYADFAASPAGRRFGRSVHGALLRVVRDTADRAALELVRAVPRERWATAHPSAGSATR